MRKSIASALDKSLYVINAILQYIEPFLAPKTYPAEYAPVFIIGAPRSGSTLFYQTLVNRFEFGYLTNLHCKCFGFPYLLQVVIGNWRPKGFQASYASVHGKTDGLWEPSECGSFWYRWFARKPQYVPMGKADPEKLRRMKYVVAGLTNAFRMPLLFKNMLCALRLRPLAAAFPDAVFLVIRRDPLMVAQSLLETRQRVHGDMHIWWSMEPPNIDEIRLLEPELQVTEQIRGIYDLIDRDAREIGGGRFLTIQYEDFCADVHGVTDHIQDFLVEHGIKINLRGEVPAQFNISSEARLDPQMMHRLTKAIRESR
jgi:hypothetical protein